MNLRILLAVAFVLNAAIAAAEPNLKIVIFPINNVGQKRTITFDGTKLSIIGPKENRQSYNLEPTKSEELMDAISNSVNKNWRGFWISHEVLDGEMMTVEISHKGEDSRFTASNGCPPGFSGILTLVDKHVQRPIFGPSWKALEEASEQYDSFEAFGRHLEEELAKSKKG